MERGTEKVTEVRTALNEADLNEANEHAQALEDAIEWCQHREAIVSFTRAGVFIKVKHNNRTIFHGTPTFLETVEDISMGRVPP